MACISLPTAALIGGGLSAGGSIIQGLSAQEAARYEAEYGQKALQQLEGLYNQTSQNFQPFISGGTDSFNKLLMMTGAGGDSSNPLYGSLTKTFNPTMEQLSQTPGYQFALQQGELATQSSYAAQGLGQSGAALKGAAGYAQGLASTTYQQQFQNYLQQNAQTYNMLAGPAQMGLSATNSLGAIAAQFGGQEANVLTGIGNAYAGGAMGVGNAAAGALGSIGQGVMGASAFGGGNPFASAGTGNTNPFMMAGGGMYSVGPSSGSASGW